VYVCGLAIPLTRAVGIDLRPGGKDYLEAGLPGGQPSKTAKIARQGLTHLAMPGYAPWKVMHSNAYIPVDVIRKDLAGIDARLSELKRESARIRDEENRLTAKRTVLSELAQKAVLPNSDSLPLTSRKDATEITNVKRQADHQTDLGQDILDGRIATPIILQMIRERPGIKSVEIIDALHSRVIKKIRKGPRKFLGDLLWELGHRNKLKRQSDGSLYLVQQGGES
jgi:hypothetical protein